MKAPDFSKNQEAQDAINIVKFTHCNVFLTGRAGTGKSTLLREIIQGLTNNFVVLAPTGIAALNIEGKTIHSFFEFPFHPLIESEPVKSYKPEKQLLISSLETLVIDEISMVRADILDHIDRTLRKLKRNNEPFGGVQLLLVGDSFQLPPVTKPEDWRILKSCYESPFFFDAIVFRETKLITIELLEVYRQQDASFIKILDAIRLNTCTDELLETLNLRASTPIDKHGILTVTTSNAVVEQINQAELAKLTGTKKIYTGNLEGSFKGLPTQLELELKVGASVMLIKNDPSGRWVNGTLAKITSLSNNKLTIQFENNYTAEVERATWENVEYRYDPIKKRVVTRPIGTYTQFPVRLCWATTIHKCQGTTFDNVLIDLNDGTWDSGQAYVALSRCRSLNGLHLKRKLEMKDIILDARVKTFSLKFNNADVYTTSRDAKMININGLMNQIEREKEALNYLEIIALIDKLLLLPINLIMCLQYSILKSYCAFRIPDATLGRKVCQEIKKYQVLNKVIGNDTIDIAIKILRAAEDAAEDSRNLENYNVLKQFSTFQHDSSFFTNLLFDYHTFPNECF